MRTWVKFERGPNAGRVGTIAGNLETRKRLIEQGLKKAIAYIEGEYSLVAIDTFRELTVQERILLGIE